MVALWVPVVVAIIAAVSGYLVREFDKRKEREAEEYRRKEERYIDLLNSLSGMRATRSRAYLLKFVTDYYLAWLYCPDGVLKRINDFLSLGNPERPSDEENNKRVFGELILAIRKDLLSRKLVKRTELTPSEFIWYEVK
jgi:hypothetical protein